MLLGQMDRLIVAAIDTPTPRSVVKQLDAVMPALPLRHASPLISGILNDFNQELHKLEPLSSALEQSDLAINWYMFHIKALVAILQQRYQSVCLAGGADLRAAGGAKPSGTAIRRVVYFSVCAAGGW